MPNRYLRASFIDSECINKLSAEGERIFIRLLVHVDDFGRCEADPVLLRGKLFSRQVDKITPKKIEAWLTELHTVGAVLLYTVDGKQYLQMAKWEKGRATKSKCPQPTTVGNNCFQLSTIVPYSDSDSDTDTDTDNTSSAMDGFAEFWSAYPRKVGKEEARKAWRKAKDKPATAALVAMIDRLAMTDQWAKDGGKFVPHASTWLNKKRWLDEIEEPTEAEMYAGAV